MMGGYNFSSKDKSFKKIDAVSRVGYAPNRDSQQLHHKGDKGSYLLSQLTNDLTEESINDTLLNNKVSTRHISLEDYMMYF
jgi:hypothetical protein